MNMVNDAEYALDVIICTHNPRADFLERVLASLEKQTVTQDQWRLIVVDNASSEQSAQQIVELLSASELTNATIRKEGQPGLVHARLAGIAESAADWLLFVDDDNCLNPDFIENGFKLIKAHAELGCFGGSIVPEFECDVDEGLESYLPSLALRKVEQPAICRDYDFDHAPYGAGMYVRREVAEAYRAKVMGNEQFTLLGRRANILSGAEDLDIAFTACDAGYAFGLFPDLKLIHLIPKSRINKEYLDRLCEGSGRSHVHLCYHRWPDKMGYGLLARRAVELCAAWFLPFLPERPRKIAYRRGQVAALRECLFGSKAPPK